MKNLFLSIFLLTTAIPVFSQTEKGDFLVGGTFGFRTNKNNSSFTLMPNGGYFVANNLAVGANFTLNFEREGGIKSTNVGLGPFVRYYIGEVTFRPFLTGAIGYLHNSYKANNVKISSSGFNTLLGLGYAAFISQDVALEGIAGYSYTEFKNAGSSNGFSLNFGFQVYINKGKMGELRRGKLE